MSQIAGSAVFVVSEQGSCASADKHFQKIFKTWT